MSGPGTSLGRTRASSKVRNPVEDEFLAGGSLASSLHVEPDIHVVEDDQGQGRDKPDAQVPLITPDTVIREYLLILPPSISTQGKS